MGLREALTHIPRKRLVILVDTNFLIYIAKGLIAPSMILDAVEYPYTLVTVEPVVRELEALSASKPPSVSRYARAARERILPKLVSTIIEGEGEADDILLLTALKLKGEGYRVLIATGDKVLRGRAREHGIPTLYYRESEGILESEWEVI